ncbi:MAG: hypothetical protein NVSMB33_17970 [Ktedonobacteraceae bacterium]
MITSLFIEAVRQGHACWFRVVSKSMLPLLHLGDEVYIKPAIADEIGIGEIAAFETAEGLVIHRIVHTQHIEGGRRLLQMSDAELLPSWVKEQAVVGRVVSIRHSHQQKTTLRQMNLSHPIAKWCGMVTAHVRYRLYLCGTSSPLRIVMRLCSRLCIHGSAWCIGHWCTSSASES